MLTVVRRGQIRGATVIDASTLAYLGEVEEIWLNERGKVAYLSSSVGYLPWEQVADISDRSLSTYGRLVVGKPLTLRRLHQLAVHSASGEPLGWVEDFLFDWQTGEIVAYILAGEIAGPWGERAVLPPESVEEIAADALRIRPDAQKHLKSESEGLSGFLSEKSSQVRNLVKILGDRLHYSISPQDRPEAVRVKIKAVSDEMTASGHHDSAALAEATAYLHERWESLQHSIERAGRRAKAALDSAWKHLTSQP